MVIGKVVAVVMGVIVKLKVLSYYQHQGYSYQ